MPSIANLPDGVKRELPLGGYPRVSRKGERADDRFRSPDFQVEVMGRWASAHRRAVRYFPAEIDVSGSRGRRPILDELIAAIEAGELGGILVARLSRLSRLTPGERIELVERIDAAGGEILSATENIDRSTPEGRFAFEVFLGIARMEYERYADQFDHAKRNAIENGIAIKPKAPIGYRVGAGRGLEVVEHEAEVVREIFRRRAEGESRGTLLAYLEEQTGRSSHRSTIGYMTRNRVYLGELRYGRKVELVKVDAHEPIVDVDLFDAVQAVDRRRSTGPGRGNRPKSLLAGIARCESCGRGLVSTRTGSGRAYSYKCPADARHCGARAQIPAELLDRFVEDAIVDWVGPEIADELVEVEAELDAKAPRIVLEHQLEQAEEALARWAADVAAELDDAAAYRAGLEARRQLVERRRGELEAI